MLNSLFFFPEKQSFEWTELMWYTSQSQRSKESVKMTKKREQTSERKKAFRNNRRFYFDQKHSSRNYKTSDRHEKKVKEQHSRQEEKHWTETLKGQRTSEWRNKKKMQTRKCQETCNHLSARSFLSRFCALGYRLPKFSRQNPTSIRFVALFLVSYLNLSVIFFVIAVSVIASCNSLQHTRTRADKCAFDVSMHCWTHWAMRWEAFHPIVHTKYQCAHKWMFAMKKNTTKICSLVLIAYYPTTNENSNCAQQVK